MAKYRITPSSKAIIQLPISIGHKAEKGVEAIEFDVTAWVETYGSGTLTVIMRRWGDAIPYPIALEIDENNKATWTLSDTDTAKAGMAYAQLSYIVGETVVKKSDIYTFRVTDSLTGEGEPPEAYESWLEHLMHLAAEAMAEVLDIEGIVTDKTLTVDGGIADAKATGDALSALEDQFTEETDQLKADLEDSFSKVLYNKTFKLVLINGEQMSSQGVISENTNYSRTDYIDLDGVPTFQFNRAADNTSSGTINAMCFFNAEKIRISGATSNIVGVDIDVPQNAKYVMYSGNTSRITGAEMTFKNLASPIKEIYNELDTKASVSEVFGDGFLSNILPIQNVRGISKYIGNLIDVEECVNNSYVNQSNGNFVNNSAYFRTGYIPVESGKTYKSNVGRNLAWYTSDKVYISGVYGTNIQQGVTAPENASFIAFTVNKSNDGITSPFDLYFAESDNYNIDVTIDGLVAEPSVWVRHKKINWIGDSIVDGADFDEVVCNALGLTKLTTDGVDGGINGSTIALKADGTDGRNALCLRYSRMPNDADIIAVSCGTNDFQYAWCPIGDIESASNSTFYGALKTLCEGLINKYPQGLIFFTTPIKRAQAFVSGDGGEYTADGVMTTPFSKNKYGKTLGDYADIIKEVCGYYSIPVLDMYRESLLNPHLASQQNLFDSALTHPNTAGQKIMARRIAGWITQLGYLIE